MLAPADCRVDWRTGGGGARRSRTPSSAETWLRTRLPFLSFVLVRCRNTPNTATVITRTTQICVSVSSVLGDLHAVCSGALTTTMA